MSSGWPAPPTKICAPCARSASRTCRRTADHRDGAMPMKPRVFVALPLASQHIEMLQEHCEVEVYGGAQPITPDDLMAGIAEAHAVLGSAQLRFPAEVLDGAPRLRAICNVGVGYDNVDLQELAARGITIANTPAVLNDAVADLVM